MSGLASDIARAMENAELARSIAGHAAEEHFSVDAEEGANIIESVLESPDSLTRNLQNERTAYYKDGVIVIKNPRVPYGGTAYPGSFSDFLKLR